GRLVITLALIASVHPVLLVPFVVALVTVRVAPWRAKIERAVQEAAGPDQRLARHLFELGATAGPAKEIRVGGLERMIVERRQRAWQSWYDAVASARRASAWWYTASWSLFALCYVSAIVLATSVLDTSAGDVLLVLAAGANLSRYLGVTVGEAEFLRWTLDASQRLLWLEDYAARH